MRFRAELPRETHPLLASIVKRFESIDSAGVSRGRRRAVLMLSPKGLSMSAVAATEDVLAFAELSTDLFVDFRVASQAEDCILVSLALAHRGVVPISMGPPPFSTVRRPQPRPAPTAHRKLSRARELEPATLRRESRHVRRPSHASRVALRFPSLFWSLVAKRGALALRRDVRFRF